jgi:hypothetical protein
MHAVSMFGTGAIRGNNALDWWTKRMVTMIAIALSVIAWKLPLIGAGYAQSDCGRGEGNPCYIAASGQRGLKVTIDNAYQLR